MAFTIDNLSALRHEKESINTLVNATITNSGERYDTSTVASSLGHNSTTYTNKTVEERICEWVNAFLKQLQEKAKTDVTSVKYRNQGMSPKLQETVCMILALTLKINFGKVQEDGISKLTFAWSHSHNILNPQFPQPIFTDAEYEAMKNGDEEAGEKIFNKVFGPLLEKK